MFLHLLGKGKEDLNQSVSRTHKGDSRSEHFMYWALRALWGRLCRSKHSFSIEINRMTLKPCVLVPVRWRAYLGRCSIFSRRPIP